MNEERTGKCLRQGDKYTWSLVTQIFHNGQPSHGGDRKTVSDDFNLTKRNRWFISFLVSSNPLSRKSW